MTALGRAGTAGEQQYYCASFVSLGFYSLSHFFVSFFITIICIIIFYFASVIKLSLS